MKPIRQPHGLPTNPARDAIWNWASSGKVAAGATCCDKVATLHDHFCPAGDQTVQYHCRPVVSGVLMWTRGCVAACLCVCLHGVGAITLELTSSGLHRQVPIATQVQRLRGRAGFEALVAQPSPQLIPPAYRRAAVTWFWFPQGGRQALSNAAGALGTGPHAAGVGAGAAAARARSRGEARRSAACQGGGAQDPGSVEATVSGTRSPSTCLTPGAVVGVVLILCVRVLCVCVVPGRPWSNSRRQWSRCVTKRPARCAWKIPRTWPSSVVTRCATRASRHWSAAQYAAPQSTCASSCTTENSASQCGQYACTYVQVWFVCTPTCVGAT